ncbi:hypothetical protein LguiB_005880 [Lonicera macranthoides]
MEVSERLWKDYIISAHTLIHRSRLNQGQRGVQLHDLMQGFGKHRRRDGLAHQTLENREMIEQAEGTLKIYGSCDDSDQSVTQSVAARLLDMNLNLSKSLSVRQYRDLRFSRNYLLHS